MAKKTAAEKVIFAEKAFSRVDLKCPFQVTYTR